MENIWARVEGIRDILDCMESGEEDLRLCRNMIEQGMDDTMVYSLVIARRRQQDMDPGVDWSGGR